VFRLEFEKIYFPYLLMAKKRYAGLYWTNPDKYDKLDCKGIETVRRDNCQLVRTVIDTCLRKILIDQKVDEAVNYAKSQISALLHNRIDISLLIVSKSISGGDYKNKQPHVEVAEKMRKRDAG
jgi:DNA polymerase delta subunit 1